MFAWQVVFKEWLECIQNNLQIIQTSTESERSPLVTTNKWRADHYYGREYQPYNLLFRIYLQWICNKHRCLAMLVRAKKIYKMVLDDSSRLKVHFRECLQNVFYLRFLSGIWHDMFHLLNGCYRLAACLPKRNLNLFKKYKP